MSRTMSELGRFLSEAVTIVGHERVVTEEAALQRYERAPLVEGVPPGAIVRPSSSDQVATLVKLARQSRVNLVLSSSDLRRRTRGDTVPAAAGVIVDLSGMDRIVRMDRRNKVALIEPGVTFPRLIAAADEAGMKAHQPLLPPRGKSVIASYLEREPVLIPKYHWDMADPLLCTELVFGTGEVFRTGSAAGPGTLEQQWSVGVAQNTLSGPGQSDLVRLVQGAQGTIAAVTWATVKLEVKPTVQRFHFVPSPKLSRLVEFAYHALRRRLCDEFLILDARALATVLADDPTRIDALAAKQAPYTLIYSVSGYKYFPEERVAWQEQALAAIARQAAVEPLQAIPGCSAKRIGTLLGAPSPEPYYKLRPKGGFVDIVFLTTLDRVHAFIETLETEAHRLGSPRESVGVYLQPIQQGRALHAEFSLYYDPADEADTNRMKQLHHAVTRRLADAGAFFSRPYGPVADLAYARCPDTQDVLRKMKRLFDPDHILNRGKLCFGEAA